MWAIRAGYVVSAEMVTRFGRLRSIGGSGSKVGSAASTRCVFGGYSNDPHAVSVLSSFL